jgi:hypothetical protein
MPVLAQPIGPATDASVVDARNEARWAELEAQSRIIEGDYEGAVHAQQQADAARRTADRLEAFARPVGQPRR